MSTPWEGPRGVRALSNAAQGLDMTPGHCPQTPRCLDFTEPVSGSLSREALPRTRALTWGIPIWPDLAPHPSPWIGSTCQSGSFLPRAPGPPPLPPSWPLCKATTGQHPGRPVSQPAFSGSAGGCRKPLGQNCCPWVLEPQGEAHTGQGAVF